MSELKACPCGKIPSRLCISEPSQSKYQRCYGDCCNEWEIEFRADYLKLGDPKMYDMAVEAWNRMPRDTRPNDAKAMIYQGLRELSWVDNGDKSLAELIDDELSSVGGSFSSQDMIDALYGVCKQSREGE